VLNDTFSQGLFMLSFCKLSVSAWWIGIIERKLLDQDLKGTLWRIRCRLLVRFKFFLIDGFNSFVGLDGVRNLVSCSFEYSSEYDDHPLNQNNHSKATCGENYWVLF